MKPFLSSITYKHVKYECVKLVTTDTYQAYSYARYVLSRRWADIGKPEVEDLIIKDSFCSFLYAKYVLKQPWFAIGKHKVVVGLI